MKHARPTTARFVRANTASGARALPVRARGAMRSEVGLIRPRNEDAAYVDPDGRFFLIADGIGGHPAGDVASATAVDVVRRRLSSGTALIDDARLSAAVREAHTALRQLATAEPDKRGMGTTFDAVAIVGRDAIVAHAGDSRVYLIRDRRTTPLTRDHTLSPKVTTLVNALGVAPEVAVDVSHHAVQPGDRLLLCTDGLYEHFREEELAGVVASAAPAVALDELVALACACGGDDNITGIIVDITAPGATEEWGDETTVQRTLR